MKPVLHLHGISKSYGTIRALDQVTLEIPEGSIFGILGPNGSGKTTLLSIVLDVIKSDQGNFSWFGENGSYLQRKKIGSLLETPNFYHYLSARDNLKVTQSISGRGMENDIDEVLKKVKLYERRKSKFSTFSLGMKQRLAIAAALLGSPRLLVLDEPTNGLDPEGIAEIRELIVELNRAGHTIIMASHLLDEVEKVCTHVSILKTGNILASGSVDEVILDEDVIELSSDNITRLTEIMTAFSAGVTSVTEKNGFLQVTFQKGTAKPGTINRFCFDNGITLTHLQQKKKKLETKFFELTNN